MATKNQIYDAVVILLDWVKEFTGGHRLDNDPVRHSQFLDVREQLEIILNKFNQNPPYGHDSVRYDAFLSLVNETTSNMQRYVALFDRGDSFSSGSALLALKRVYKEFPRYLFPSIGVIAAGLVVTSATYLMIWRRRNTG